MFSSVDERIIEQREPDRNGIDEMEKVIIKATLKDHTEWKTRDKIIKQNMIKNVKILKDYL